jgi:predicted outer membrane repeat protein
VAQKAGGSVNIEEFVTNLIIDDNTFVRSSANGNIANNANEPGGGAICIFQKSPNAQITRNTFEACRSTGSNNGGFGGAVTIGNENLNMLVDNNTFTGCTATGGGGGIYTYLANEVTVSNNAFDACTADGSGGGLYIGEESDDFTLSHNTFKNTSAVASGGAVHMDDDHAESMVFDSNTFQDCRSSGTGGAIHVSSGAFETIDSNFMVSSTTFTNCEADSEGGAIYISDTNTQAITVVDTDFNGCTAGTSGGGVYVSGTSGLGQITDLTFSRVNFTGGSATMFGGHIATIFASSVTVNQGHFSTGESTCATVGCGGGSMYFIDSTVVVTDSTMSANNAASGNGGAMLIDSKNSVHVTNGYFSGNTASLGGGAIYVVDDNELGVSNTTFFENSASSDDGGALQVDGLRNNAMVNDSSFSRNVAGNYGGGVAMGGNASSATDENSLTLVNVDFNSNGAKRGGGLGAESGMNNIIAMDVHFRECFSTDGGGGVSLNNTAKLALSSCSFNLNHCAGGNGGAVEMVGDSTTSAGTYTTFTSTNTILVRNSAAANGGAMAFTHQPIVSIVNMTATINAADGNGGVIFANFAKTFTMRESSFWGNAADNGGAAYLDEFSFGTGSRFIEEIEIKNCTAANNGGGIYFNTGILGLTVTGANISTSEAANDGGALYFASNNTDVSFNEMVLDSCNAGRNGGAVYLSDSNSYIMFSNLMANNCNAGRNGGAAYLSDSNSFAKFSNFMANNCSASQNGGAFYLDSNNDNMMVSSGSFRQCEAKWGAGGAVSANAGNSFLALTDVAVEACQAGTHGGALMFNETNSFSTFLSVRLDSNLAGGDGGAMWMGMGNDNNTFTNVTFIKNTASGSGGGLALATSNRHTSVSASVFKSNTAAVHGGGIFLATENDWLTLQSVALTLNTASMGSGGAVFVYGTDVNGFNMLGNDYVKVVNCSIAHNDAKVGGGAVAFMSYNNWANLSDNALEANTALSGGAVYTGSANNLTMVGNTMVGNWATDQGGSVFMQQGNYLWHFSNSDTESYAVDSGGSLYADEGNSLWVWNCTISDTNAIYGGAAHFETDNYLSVRQSAFADTAAERRGGAVSVGMSNKMAIDGTSFTKTTTGGHGGAIFFENYGNDVSMKNVTFTETSAAGNGGAVDLSGAFESFVLSGITFTSTTAGQDGGALYFGPAAVTAEDTDLMELSSVVIVNSSAADGGGIYIDHDNVGMNLYGIEFDNCQASSSGGAVYVNSRCSDFRAAGLHVTDPSAGLNGAGIFLLGDSTNVSLSHMTVEGGSAGGSGGAVYVHQNVDTLTLDSVEVHGCSATYGGGVHVNFAVNGITLTNATFTDNMALMDGGGLYLAERLLNVNISDAVFAGNAAAGKGGGLYVGAYNGDPSITISGASEAVASVEIANAIFHSNNASYGGGVYLNEWNAISMYSTSLTKNSADKDGGAVFISTNNNVDISRTTIETNSAGNCGGGVNAMSDNWVGVEEVSVKGNSADWGGGGFCVQANSVLTLDGSVAVDSNSAVYWGGGMLVRESRLFQTTASAVVTINSNDAEFGSALALFSVIDSITARDANGTIEMKDNTASHGGTVYWQYDDDMKREPVDLKTERITFTANRVAYGLEFATNAVTLELDGDGGPVMVTVYDAPIAPTPTATLRDFYEQTVQNDYHTLGTFSALLPIDDCGINAAPGVEGASIYTARDGVIFATNLELSCYPLGSMVVETVTSDLFSTAQLSGSGLSLAENGLEKYYPSANVTYKFRACTNGESDEGSDCVSCPQGSYTLEWDSTPEDDSDNFCKACPRQAETCYGAQIWLKEGYWRRENYTYAILDCPYDGSCLGGTGTGQTLCREGHTGPMCGVCDVDNFFHVFSQKCEHCDGDHSNVGYRSFYSFMFWLMVGLAVLVYYKTFWESTVATTLAIAANTGWLQFTDGTECFFAYMLEHQFTLTSKGKIIISTLQVVVLTSQVFHVVMPKSWNDWSDGFSMVNLNVHMLLPLECILDGYDYVDRLMVELGAACLAVLGLGVLLCLELFYLTQCKGPMNREAGGQSTNERRRMSVLMNPTTEEARDRMTSSYSYVALLLVFCILPSLTLTLVRTFPCTDIDPDDEDGSQDSAGDLESDRYMTADLSISCDSDRYKLATLIATIGIVVVPVGVPLIMLYFLNAQKAAIQDVHDRLPGPDIHEETHDLRAMHQLRFLFQPYLPEFWYWDIVDVYRKILLVAIVGVTDTGSSAQLVFGVFVAIMCVRVTTVHRVHRDEHDNTLAEMGSIAILCTYFAALVKDLALLKDMQSESIAVALILINAAIFIFAILQLTGGYALFHFDYFVNRSPYSPGQHEGAVETPSHTKKYPRHPPPPTTQTKAPFAGDFGGNESEEDPFASDEEDDDEEEEEGEVFVGQNPIAARRTSISKGEKPPSVLSPEEQKAAAGYRQEAFSMWERIEEGDDAMGGMGGNSEGGGVEMAPMGVSSPASVASDSVRSPMAAMSGARSDDGKSDSEKNPLTAGLNALPTRSADVVVPVKREDESRAERKHRKEMEQLAKVHPSFLHSSHSAARTHSRTHTYSYTHTLSPPLFLYATSAYRNCVRKSAQRRLRRLQRKKRR